jgi:type I restriction enzyme M protein
VADICGPLQVSSARALELALNNSSISGLSSEDIERIAGLYRAWRSEDGAYADEAGFCKSATLEEMAGHGYVLTPGRYVGAADVEDDGEPFEEKMARLSATLRQQFAESERLQAVIRENLRQLGYDE